MCQQVQDIEFMQIEMKVIEGLKVGNDCLKSMHEVGVLFFFFFFFFISLFHLRESYLLSFMCVSVYLKHVKVSAHKHTLSLLWSLDEDETAEEARGLC